MTILVRACIVYHVLGIALTAYSIILYVSVLAFSGIIKTHSRPPYIIKTVVEYYIDSVNCDNKLSFIFIKNAISKICSFIFNLVTMSSNTFNLLYYVSFNIMYKTSFEVFVI